MRVALAPFMVPGKKDPVITIALGLTQPPVSSRQIFAVDVQTNAYTADGRPRFVGQRHTATVTLVPTSHKDAARYDLLTEFRCRRGSTNSGCRPIARPMASAAVYADLEVPDFNAPLSASGVVVETVPAGATAPIGAFDRFRRSCRQRTASSQDPGCDGVRSDLSGRHQVHAAR
jgi:hypothetical protein